MSQTPDLPPAPPAGGAGPQEAARGRLPELKGTLTHTHLREAFAVDSQAAALCAAFARVAEIEGAPELARALREIAEQRALFAEGHLALLVRAGDPLSGRPLGGSGRNLAAALHAELVAAEDGAPRMARTAHNEGFPDVASWFESTALAHAGQADRLRALGDK